MCWLIYTTIGEWFLNLAFFSFNLFNLNNIMLIILKYRWNKRYPLIFICFFESIRCTDSWINPNPIQYLLFCFPFMLDLSLILNRTLVPQFFQVNIYLPFICASKHSTLEQLYVQIRPPAAAYGAFQFALAFKPYPLILIPVDPIGCMTILVIFNDNMSRFGRESKPFLGFDSLGIFSMF